MVDDPHHWLGVAAIDYHLPRRLSPQRQSPRCPNFNYPTQPTMVKAGLKLKDIAGHGRCYLSSQIIATRKRI